MQENKTNQRILFICTGNICRSPSAEGVARHMAEQKGLNNTEFDSAALTGYHIGAAPDKRAQVQAERKGYDLSSLRARMIEAGDYYNFDLILGMDQEHKAMLLKLAPDDATAKIGLLMDFALTGGYKIVPDPYQGDESDFVIALTLIEQGCSGLIDHLLSSTSV